MCLGARQADIAWLLIRHSMVPVVLGILLGLAGAMATQRPGRQGFAVGGKRVGGAVLLLPGRDENPFHLGCMLLNPLTSTRIRSRVAGSL
jgi:hypothetical protein